MSAKYADMQIADLMRKARGPWGHGWAMLSQDQRELAIKAAAFDWMSSADAFRGAATDAISMGADRDSKAVLRELARDSDALRSIIQRVLALVDSEAT